MTCQWQEDMTTEFNVNLLKKICGGLDADGYVVIDDAFPLGFMIQLQGQVKKIAVDEFKQAGIGRAVDFKTDTQIRGDKISWLDENDKENQKYFNWIETLRVELNKQFYLGLCEYECMFAHYPKGAFYHKHVDAFKKPNHQFKAQKRVVSTLLYLNSGWNAEDGGELLLYRHNEENSFKKILPELGRLVIFLSEEFPHEVLPAKKSRYSLTGWFRSQS